MWCYEKRLQYPIKITKTDPNMAQLIISQYGGPYAASSNQPQISSASGFQGSPLLGSK